MKKDNQSFVCKEGDVEPVYSLKLHGIDSGKDRSENLTSKIFLIDEFVQKSIQPVMYFPIIFVIIFLSAKQDQTTHSNRLNRNISPLVKSGRKRPTARRRP